MGNQQESNYEIFLPHPVYTRLYVGNKGTIRKKDGSLKYSRVNKKGYSTIQIKVSGKVIDLKVHRLVAETHLPPPEKALVDKCKKEHWGEVLVKHLDNNKLNNKSSNLEWSDVESNTKDAYRDNLVPFLKGSLNGRAILDETVVHTICKFYEDGGMPKDAEIIFGISRSQATKIRSGHAWKHVWKDYKILVNKRS